MNAIINMVVRRLVWVVMAKVVHKGMNMFSKRRKRTQVDETYPD